MMIEMIETCCGTNIFRILLVEPIGTQLFKNFLALY
jgi:hypothetical protein